MLFSAVRIKCVVFFVQWSFSKGLKDLLIEYTYQ